jgi:hypothetical protein
MLLILPGVGKKMRSIIDNYEEIRTLQMKLR